MTSQARPECEGYDRNEKLFCHKYGYTICTDRHSKAGLQEINIKSSFTTLAWEGPILSVQQVECLWDSDINLFFVSGARFSLLVNLTTTLNLHKLYSIEREESSQVWDEKELAVFVHPIQETLWWHSRRLPKTTGRITIILSEN